MNLELLLVSNLIISTTLFIYLSIFKLKYLTVSIICIALFLWVIVICVGILIHCLSDFNINNNLLYTLTGINSLLTLGLLTFLNYYLQITKK